MEKVSEKIRNSNGQLKEAIRENFSEIKGVKEIIIKLKKRYKIGVTKPHRKAFKSILNTLGSKPNESIFIDDQDINLLVAREIGIFPVKFIDSKQLLFDLKNLGVKI